MHVPELLAPAGSPEACLAAIAAGADAVYLGLHAFNARAGSVGFSLNELRQAVHVAHEHGVRVYVALNVLVYDNELDEAFQLGRSAIHAGADALIVADIGLAQRFSQQLPEAEIHISTQAGVQSAEAVKLAQSMFGATRITCARELSVEEITALCAAGVEIECFVHGAICICYSGACSFSALRRGRHANRGDCTQPCRQDYALVNEANELLAGRVELVDAQAPRHSRSLGAKLICPRDYLGIRQVAALAAAGVGALKIEGRMKHADYVYNVVRSYRALLDRYAAGIELDEAFLAQTEMQLARSFNRGFTSVYPRGVRARSELMSRARACNQGACVGEVRDTGHEWVRIAFEEPVQAGDTLEIRTTPGEDAPSDVPTRWPMIVTPVDVAAHTLVKLRCKRRVEPGSKVHLTRDTALIAEAEAAVASLHAAWNAAGLLGEQTAEHESQCMESAEQSCACCGAFQRRVIEEIRVETGRSCVELAVPSSALCDARAHSTVSTGLDAVRLCHAPEEIDEESSFAQQFVYAWQLRDELERWEPYLSQVSVVLDELFRPQDLSELEMLLERAGAFVARNLGQIEVLAQAGKPFEVMAPVSVWNRASAVALAARGATRLWLPEELDAPAMLRCLPQLSSVLPVGIVAAGTFELMVMEHCVLTAEGPCDAQCASCERRHTQRALLATNGARLPLLVDNHGRTRIFNSESRFWTYHLAEFQARGLSAYLQMGSI
ncbi:U32 family peptidase [Collinsella sp. zg1085]|uniref:peptidase U32 family protein n=1 Tax=Collinsella sp. zg1085 TaxID=2844380 RepID=UPI001C0B793E|nr:peptidase U32 family protein [Collinsella sp. zg1085]QWT17306.1 U32 family peptidase [Collinsella sp. zg1085]